MRLAIICALLSTLATAQAQSPTLPPTLSLPAMPVGVSSLGAAICGEQLYIYGGHSGKTHSYDTESVLGTFHRLPLRAGAKWEVLPSGPILQGLSLTEYQGKLIRVGGMSPRNAPGQAADIHSTAEVAVFDPKIGRWEPMAALPHPRSSHDAVVVGNRLYVIGGWQSRGQGTTPIWHDSLLMLDLSNRDGKWESQPQPFRKRALSAVVHDGKIIVLGGLQADGAAERSVDQYDVTAKSWTKLAELPGSSDRVGFSPAATIVKGRVVINTLMGPIHRLSADGKMWEEVGRASNKRLVHRIVTLDDNTIAVVGGASGGVNLTDIEVIRLADQGKPVQD